MLCIVFKVPPNLIGSQYEKLIIQKLNVTFDIISDYHGHASIVERMLLIFMTA